MGRLGGLAFFGESLGDRDLEVGTAKKRSQFGGECRKASNSVESPTVLFLGAQSMGCVPPSSVQLSKIGETGSGTPLEASNPGLGAAKKRSQLAWKCRKVSIFTFWRASGHPIFSCQRSGRPGVEHLEASNPGLGAAKKRSQLAGKCRKVSIFVKGHRGPSGAADTASQLIIWMAGNCQPLPIANWLQTGGRFLKNVVNA